MSSQYDRRVRTRQLAYYSGAPSFASRPRSTRLRTRVAEVAPSTAPSPSVQTDRRTGRDVLWESLSNAVLSETMSIDEFQDAYATTISVSYTAAREDRSLRFTSNPMPVGDRMDRMFWDAALRVGRRHPAEIFNPGYLELPGEGVWYGVLSPTPPPF